MNKILWVQSNTSLKPDTIVNNKGDIMNFDEDYFSCKKSFDRILFFEDTLKEVYKKENVVAKSNRVNDFFFTSSFIEKDDIGRRIVYMFYTNYSSSDEIIENFMFFLKIVDKTICPVELNQLKEIINRLEKKSSRGFCWKLVYYLNIIKLWIRKS